MKYDSKVLERLKDVECDLLKNFQRVCKKYDIQYFAQFGTAIGAMRHGDFIPWDDDIDICIFRDDAEKLRRIPAEEWGEDFITFPDQKGTAFHRMCFPRLYRKNTVFSNAANRDLIISDTGYLTPIWIDIFVFDRVESLAYVKKTRRKKILLRKAYRLCKSDLRVKWSGSAREFFRLVYRKILHCIITAFTTPEKIYEKYNSLTDHTGEYATTFDCMENDEPLKLFCRYEDMFPLREVKFRDTTIYVTNNIEEVLNNMYGDYMKLPPEDKRVNHCPVILDFGDGVNVIEEESTAKDRI